MAFEFIKNELTEARLLRNEQNLPKTADTLINSLYLHILTLEILRHENPGLAKNYAKRTLQYQTFDKIRTSATDLHNQLAVLTNKDLYHDKIKYQQSQTYLYYKPSSISNTWPTNAMITDSADNICINYRDF